MVRAGGVTAASRQLASRLNISVLEPTDLSKFEDFYPTDLNFSDGALAMLFDEQQVGSAIKAFTTLDKRLDKLVEYRQFDYWVYEEHRNLLQVVAHLEQVSKHLDPQQPAHRALFLDCAWLYALSLAHATQHVRAVNVSDLDNALKQYLFGGQMALQEKERLATVLQRLAPATLPSTADEGVLPGWYSQLLDLLTRHLRRPNSINNELRYAEWATEAQLAKEPSTAVEAFGNTFDPIAAKILADVCGFLVTTANLAPGFRSFARTMFAQPQQ
jgi:hypothetical protein